MSILIKGMKMPKSGVYRVSIDNVKGDIPVMAVLEPEPDEEGHLVLSCYALEEVPDKEQENETDRP